MKTAAIIAEFNPYHNGHRYLIQKAREGGADHIVCLVSGDFVQRGSPAAADRWARAEMALADADLILSFPTRFASASAEEFADAGVRILDGLGCVDELWFGSESGELSELFRCARVLAEEPDWYRKKLGGNLKQGMPFAAAREAAFSGQEGFSKLLGLPNNILALEYLKALLRSGAQIEPHTVRRVGALHHDSALPGNLYEPGDGNPCILASGNPGTDGNVETSNTGISVFASASAIRSLANDPEMDPEQLRKVMPPEAFSIFRKEIENEGLLTEEDLSDLLLGRLWDAGCPEDLASFKEVSPELSRTMFRERNRYGGFKEFEDLLTSKTVTRSHARRALLFTALGIRRDPLPDRAAFTQVLAMNSAGEELLSMIRKSGKCRTEVAVNVKTEEHSFSDAGKRILSEELRVSNLYESLRCLHRHGTFTNELNRKLIRR